MKKRLLFGFLLMAGCMLGMNATPPVKKYFAVKQSDGTSVLVQKQGNAHSGFLVTEDGLSCLRNGKNLYYAVLDKKGTVVCSDMLVHATDKRSDIENEFIKQHAISHDKMNLMLPVNKTTIKAAANSEDGLGVYGKSAGGVVSTIGKPTIPVVMVEFADRKFLKSTTEEKLTRMLCEKGYADEPYCVGSVKDYFAAQSDSLFIPNFEVVAKVCVANDYAYYGANKGTSRDVNKKSFIEEAVALAVEAGADFSKYKDGNAVPLVSIFFAGPGEHSAYEEGCDDYLWAHFSTINTLYANDVKIASYFVGNEVLQSYGGTESAPVVTGEDTDGIGIFVHEFGHALGLPDFYYTGSNQAIYNRLETLCYWSVMDYGHYWRDGYAPVGYNAYERSFCGWLTPQELTEAGYMELYSYAEKEKGATTYILRSATNEKEYFLLENRQEDTWYPALLGTGMLITHIDYDATSWTRNILNNTENRQRFSYVPADGDKYLVNGSGEGFRGDLYPGVKGITEFTDESVPTAAKLNDGTYLGKPIYNIKEEKKVISFSFLDKTMTGISDVETIETSYVEIYDLYGRIYCKGNKATLGNVNEKLPKGIYIYKCGNESKRILVD